jgi:hypothetical protein
MVVVIVVFGNVVRKMILPEEFERPKRMQNTVDQPTIDEMKEFDQ